MPAKSERPLSGWRARRLLRAGGLIVRDGTAFLVHQRADERSRRCGRLPPHIVARLKGEQLLAAFRGDPDRLVQAGEAPAVRLKPLAVSDPAESKAPGSLLDLAARRCAEETRLRAAASRFGADYHLAASPGGRRTDDPRLQAAARLRLEALEEKMGADRAEAVEMLVLDRLTPSAFRHVTGQGLPEAQGALTKLAEVYGLLAPGQLVGRALASS
ncbi:hypothetical protein [Hyphomonas jannaschiana]|uniref:hypothetical protein n=1 Tax=Hyphomonas jannaschiana TaxID=86 RepID=UPI0035C6CE0C